MEYDFKAAAEVRARLDAEADARHRKARREELAAMLLLKLVETNPQALVQTNVRAAVEYTDALLAKLEEPK